MISFIVPAYNEAPLIARTLQALNEAGSTLCQRFEVVVADDASTDRTAAIAKAHGASVVPVHHRQIGATRNAGARAATGERLIFVDADTIVTPSVVHAATEAMREGAAGGGCAFRFGGSLPFYGRIFQETATPLYRMLGLARGCFLFCTRQAFQATGGFDERLFAGEEGQLSRALRREGRFVVLHESVTTSGRRFRTHTAREHLSVLVQLALSGERGLRQRKGLDAWYGERRTDTERVQ